MSVSFGQARAAVKKELGLDSSREGYEDAIDYSVLVNPPLHDEVVLVTKDDGEVHRELFFDEADRLAQMLPVSDDEGLLPTAPRLA